MKIRVHCKAHKPEPVIDLAETDISYRASQWNGSWIKVW